MSLPEEDMKYLRDKEYEFTCEQVGSAHLLVIKDFDLPDQFTPQCTDLLLEIPAGYPDAGLDMFWVHPEVRLTETNGYPQAADDFAREHNGVRWQRFSRHGYPWKPGEDSIASYLVWVKRSFEIDAGLVAQ